MTDSASTRDAGVTLRVLGDFIVTVDDQAVAVGGPRQKAVLARVLAGADEAVSAEQIVEDIWGEQSAGSTVASVHAYVSRLRRLLGGEAIPRRAGRYVIDRGVVTVDADLFVDDVSRGRAALARGEDDTAAAILDAALARWHGPDAFGSMREAQFLAPLAARWEELRVVAAEALADAHARSGRAGDDVALLQELAARDPLRESVAVRLVRALYAAGRQADALAAFERCRHALAEQLGVDPAPALRRVHAAVLAQEPFPSAVSSVLPTNLPPRNRSFVGGGARCSPRSAPSWTTTPAALGRWRCSACPGVGKTELALELAHRRHRHRARRLVGRGRGPGGHRHRPGRSGGRPRHRRVRTVALDGRDSHAALWAELDRTPGWVLVFDNADEPEPARAVPARRPARRRHHHLAQPGLATARPPGRRRPAARGPSRSGYVVERTGDPAVEADTLAEQLGDLPLALEQACAYIEQTGMSVPDYVDLFRERRDSLLLRDPLDARPTVATTWGLAFDRLRLRSPRAAVLLETMAFLAPDAVAVATLRRQLAGFDDELDLHDALAELLRLSLVDRDRGSCGCTGWCRTWSGPGCRSAFAGAGSTRPRWPAQAPPSTRRRSRHTW